MADQKYIRRRATLITLNKTEDGVVVEGENEFCGSVNKAKKKSRQLQEGNGGLGCGAVRVER